MYIRSLLGNGHWMQVSCLDEAVNWLTWPVQPSVLCVLMYSLLKDERENGYLFRDLVIRRFQAMKRWFVNLGELSEETFDNLWQMALEENEEGTIALWRINCGMKPYNREAGSS